MLQGQPLHQPKHVLQIFTDASKEGWGTHLNKHTARGTWSLPESKLLLNYLELKAVFMALKAFLNLCLNSSHCYRQHHSGCLHKQGEGDEVGPSVCPSMENPDLVLQETGDP